MKKIQMPANIQVGSLVAIEDTPDVSEAFRNILCIVKDTTWPVKVVLLERVDTGWGQTYLRGAEIPMSDGSYLVLLEENHVLRKQKSEVISRVKR